MQPTFLTGVMLFVRHLYVVFQCRLLLCTERLCKRSSQVLQRGAVRELAYSIKIGQAGASPPSRTAGAVTSFPSSTPSE